MKHVSWDKISSSLCHAVQHLANAVLGGVFSMRFSCCLKGEFLVICTFSVVSFPASRIVLSSETCAFLLEARHPKSSVPGPVWWGPTILAFEGLRFFSGNDFFVNLSVRSVFCMKQCLGITKLIRPKQGNVWSGKPPNKRAIACTDKKNFVSIAKSRAFLYGTTLSDQVSWLKWGRWLFSENTHCSFLFVTHCNYCAVLSVELFWKRKITQYSKNRKEHVYLCSSSFLWN